MSLFGVPLGIQRRWTALAWMKSFAQRPVGARGVVGLSLLADDGVLDEVFLVGGVVVCWCCCVLWCFVFCLTDGGFCDV